MQTKDRLIKQFDKANLPLIPLDEPLGFTRDRNIFQMDIRTQKRKEFFRIFQGHQDNQILVQEADKKLRQLVLFVKEPKRVFEFEHVITKYQTPQQVATNIERSGGKVIRTSGRIVVEERSTPEDKRHYLCGHDESHLFIAQLPASVSTVRAAYDALRAPVARGRDARRQGEWFFVELTKGELLAVEHAAESGIVHHNMALANAFTLNSFGRRRTNVKKMIRNHQHVAEHVLIVPGVNGPNVYARGTIRHIDHKTIDLPGWTRVAMNNEPTQRTGGRGILWID